MKISSNIIVTGAALLMLGLAVVGGITLACQSAPIDTVVSASEDCKRSKERESRKWDQFIEAREEFLYLDKHASTTKNSLDRKYAANAKASADGIFESHRFAKYRMEKDCAIR